MELRYVAQRLEREGHTVYCPLLDGHSGGTKTLGASLGGVAVGVATSEPQCQVVDDWKRQRLISAGADYIVPNFLSHEQLIRTLFCP